MNEQEYISKLEEATGLSLKAGDFGFIMGLRTPFDTQQGFQSANKYPGYVIWKKEIRNDDTHYTEFHTGGVDFEDTVKFLTTPIKDLGDFYVGRGRFVTG